MANECRKPLIEENSWRALWDTFNGYAKDLNMAKMFREDPGRFNKFKYVVLLFHSHRLKCRKR